MWVLVVAVGFGALVVLALVVIDQRINGPRDW